MMLHQFATAATSARTVADLDHAARLGWRAVAAGVLSDADAQALSVALDARRAALQAKVAARALPAPPARPRRSPVSPDRAASLARRRRCAASGALPPAIAALFSTGELAALSIIAGQVRRSGRCDLPLDAIAALGGVSRTTVQNAIRAARRAGLVDVQERRRAGRKSLTNVVAIVAPEWVAWLRLSGRGDRVQKAERHEYQIKNPGKSVTPPGINSASTWRSRSVQGMIRPSRSRSEDHGQHLPCPDAPRNR